MALVPVSGIVFLGCYGILYLVYWKGSWNTVDKATGQTGRQSADSWKLTFLRNQPNVPFQTSSHINCSDSCFELFVDRIMDLIIVTLIFSIGSSNLHYFSNHQHSTKWIHKDRLSINR
jgi:hypothetical protein